MPPLRDIAPIIWAKWGDTFLETLRQEALDADDQLAFRAMNSESAVRTLLVVCTTDRAQIKDAGGTLSLGGSTRTVDWKGYSVAEMVFKTDKGSGLGHYEQQDASGPAALVLCATRPSTVRMLEAFFDLPE